MVEITVLDYLVANLSVPVYMEKPKGSGQSYVLIEKTGSSRENHIENTTLAIQSYAGSMYEAALLNETVKTVMDNLISLPGIVRAKLDTDYNFTDTQKKEYRYQAVYNLVHY